MATGSAKPHVQRNWEPRTTMCAKTASYKLNVGYRLKHVVVLHNVHDAISSVCNRARVLCKPRDGQSRARATARDVASIAHP
jgi:hypothetical protein